MFGHICCKCGKACDCMAFDISHGEVCDGCSDCAVAEVEVYEAGLDKGFVCDECGRPIPMNAQGQSQDDQHMPSCSLNPEVRR